MRPLVELAAAVILGILLFIAIAWMAIWMASVPHTHGDLEQILAAAPK